MAAIMIVLCIVMLAAGHNGFTPPHNAGASTMQMPHTQTQIQPSEEKDS